MADSDEGKMGTWMTSAIVVGGIIGAGIFMLPVTLAPLGTNALIAWPISGVGILCIAFALALISKTEEKQPHLLKARAAAKQDRLLAANLARFPTAIIEQNAVVGRANRLVMNQVKVMAAAFPIARFAPHDKSKIVLTGNPLRPEVEALWGARYDAPQAGGVLRLLVFGGSQGARAMSEIVPAALTRLPHELKTRLSVVQQCRPEDLETVRQIYANAEIKCDLQSFFSDLPRRMADSHLVIARSGAGTVAELMAIGRPAILVPLPGALDDNQTPNADILARADAGWRVAQANLTPDSLAQMLMKIFAEPRDLVRRAACAHAIAVPHAAEKLADVVENLVRAA